MPIIFSDFLILQPAVWQMHPLQEAIPHAVSLFQRGHHQHIVTA